MRPRKKRATANDEGSWAEAFRSNFPPDRSRFLRLDSDESDARIRPVDLGAVTNEFADLGDLSDPMAITQKIDVGVFLTKFFALEDEGLTKENLASFFQECGRHGAEFLKEVRLKLRALGIAAEIVNEPADENKPSQKKRPGRASNTV